MAKKSYEKYMAKALELAARGWGRTSPNPMVGAVVVRDGKICAEGFHEGPGLPHAEVAAIRAAGKAARGADLIVNLEPCPHFGRTPPCTDKIIKSGIKRVVYGVKDPNPEVNGRGIAMLKKSGVEVIGPVLEGECRSLNRIYLHWIKTGRPYLISKIAMSMDGKIATDNGSSKWITGEKCRVRMHYWRSGVDAVLVGAETVRRDDPSLDARGVNCKKQPRPVVVSASGSIDLSSRVFERQPPPVVFCKNDAECSHLEKKGVNIVRIGGRGRKLDWGTMLEKLGEMGITSVLVEGGGRIHAQLMEKKLAQYMVTSMSMKLIGSQGKEWLPGWNINDVGSAPRVNPDQILVLGDDVVVEGEVFY